MLRAPIPPILRKVDNDAVLMKHHFALHQSSWEDVSPIVIPKGYTKDYVDGQISYTEQMNTISAAYHRIQEQSDIVLCEGTGHVPWVRSLMPAMPISPQLLGAQMVLVANGSIGHSFDEISLNRTWCLERGVPIAGLVINQIKPEKYEQTVKYLKKRLAKNGLVY
jgi:dethiobiotin synthetase